MHVTGKRNVIMSSAQSIVSLIIMIIFYSYMYYECKHPKQALKLVPYLLYVNSD